MMIKDNLVSIIIPVYNVEKYLEDCLKSAIKQTFKNIEIIAVNDGSTDSSLNILEYYAKQYDNIQIINQENKGLSAARNMGLKHSKGKYIYFLDSDDYIELNMIQECVELAEKKDLDIINFDAQVFYENGVETKFKPNYDRSQVLNSSVYSGEEFYCYVVSNKVYRSSVCLSFYRRDLLQKFDLNFYEGIVHEDELFSAKAILSATKVAYSPKKYFHRRIREASIMTKAKSLKNIRGYLTVAQELYEFSLKIKDKKTKYILNNQILNFYNNCIELSILVFDNRKELFNQVKKIRKIILRNYPLKDIDKKLLVKLMAINCYVKYKKILLALRAYLN